MKKFIFGRLFFAGAAGATVEFPVTARIKKRPYFDDEIIVDCYGETERAMGWYYYLENHLEVPFIAKCIAARSISPLKTGEVVEVIGMAPEDECEHEMFVTIRWEKRKFGVPLSQVEGIKASKGTRQAIEDWRYWVSRGYEF